VPTSMSLSCFDADLRTSYALRAALPCAESESHEHLTLLMRAAVRPSEVRTERNTIRVRAERHRGRSSSIFRSISRRGLGLRRCESSNQMGHVAQSVAQWRELRKPPVKEKPVAIRHSEVARAGIEPATPRFSVGGTEHSNALGIPAHAEHVGSWHASTVPPDPGLLVWIRAMARGSSPIGGRCQQLSGWTVGVRHVGSTCHGSKGCRGGQAFAAYCRSGSWARCDGTTR